MRKHLLWLLIALLALPGAALAQDTFDPDAEPLFSTLWLDAGFVLDPFIVSVIAGGSLPAAELSEDCAGYISSTPTVILNWRGDASDLLRVFFYSDHNTVLVIRTPGGEFACADDVNPLLLDASVDLENPEPGRYAIWVGGYGESQLLPGFLVFTSSQNYSTATLDLSTFVQRGPQPGAVNLPRNDESILSLEAEPEAGTLEFSAGADESLAVTGGGEVAAFTLVEAGEQCAGYINPVPSAAITWTGESDLLRLFLESDTDGTLVVRDPNGVYYCNDDSQGSRNVNPLIDVIDPVEGTYLIFVGTFNADETLDGTLTVTDSPERTPAVLMNDN